MTQPTDVSAFAAKLPPHAPLLGLDVGDKTIGLALSDSLRTVATSYKTLTRTKFTLEAEQLRAVCAEHGIGGLVIGYPVNMDGSLGPRTQKTRAFSRAIEEALQLPVLLWDERMSTMAANRVMLDADLSRKRRAELVDKLAAAYILQGALDALGGLSA